MSEVLSQSQIDALLNSMNNSDNAQEEIQEKKKPEYRKYDFFSPKKFTKDRLKLVHGIYDNYSRIVSSRLNGLLRVSSEFNVMTVEEQRYYEFSNGLSDSDVFMLCELKLPDDSKNPPFIVHINQVLMVNMIDRMLGGLEADRNIDALYMYTDIEMALYRKIMGYMLEVTKDAWGNYIRLELGEQRLEENPSLFQEISLDEPIAIILLEVKMEDVEGIVSVCIPGTLLTSIFSVIDKGKQVESDYAQDHKRTRETILAKIKDSALTVRADLGEAKVSLQDVYGLRVGDVLDLNKPKESPLSVYVDEEAWFEGKAGVHKKNVAIKLQRRLDQGEESNGDDTEFQQQEIEEVREEPEQTDPGQLTAEEGVQPEAAQELE